MIGGGFSGGQCPPSRDGIVHLRTDDRKATELLNTGVEVVEIESEARSDKIAAALHAEMPWMAPATEVFWQTMRQSVGSGMAAFRFRLYS